MKKLDVGVLGATGMVGQNFVKFLQNHPWFELKWLGASDRSSTRRYKESTSWRLDGVMPEPVREMVVDKDDKIVRQTETDAKRPRRRPAAEATPNGSELPPGQSRKELEGVFVVRAGKAEFVAVKTGIAGDKHFEVLSGLAEGDQVVTGPFANVRNLQDQGAVKIQDTSRSRS